MTRFHRAKSSDLVGNRHTRSGLFSVRFGLIGWVSQGLVGVGLVTFCKDNKLDWVGIGLVTYGYEVCSDGIWDQITFDKVRVSQIKFGLLKIRKLRSD